MLTLQGVFLQITHHHPCVTEDVFLRHEAILGVESAERLSVREVSGARIREKPGHPDRVYINKMP